jgi:hypothetical protein
MNHMAHTNPVDWWLAGDLLWQPEEEPDPRAFQQRQIRWKVNASGRNVERLDALLKRGGVEDRYKGLDFEV